MIVLRLFSLCFSFADLLEAQQKRVIRDKMHWSTVGRSHSHIRVPKPIVDEARAMVKGKWVHHKREADNCFPSHQPRLASWHAWKMGNISTAEMDEDIRKYTRANCNRTQNEYKIVYMI